MGADRLDHTSEWLARHGEGLVSHLRAVAKLAREFAPESLAEAAELVGLVHDLGKATPFFQQRLNNPHFADPAANHAYISALFGAWVAQQRGLDALAVFLAVARHHGPLRTPAALLPDPEDIDPPDFSTIDRQGLRRVLRALCRQIPEVAKSWPSLCEKLALPDPTPFLQGEIWDILRELCEEAWRLKVHALPTLHDPQARRRYWEINILFSALIDADKKLAAQYQNPERVRLPRDLVVRYLATTSSRASPLQGQRRVLFETVARQVSLRPLTDLFPALLTLTAPTGAGKTLAVLHAALTIRARVEEECGWSPRIIYALPFINLIEQTASVIRNVLVTGGFNPDDVLIEHHHLAPLVRRGASHTAAQAANQDQFEEDLDVDEALLLAESWDAEIVLTTFVQVFHTLVGYQNRALKKLHTLVSGSILILDEVQALDAHYWPLLRALLADLPEWNVTVILMTATQPRLVESGAALELVDPPLTDYPSRVVLQPIAPQTIPELAEAIAGIRDRSQLIVVNSIRVSLELYRALERYSFPYLYYLSTNITPRDRRRRLAEIQKLLMAREPVVLVSTQVVEAGIDVDFQVGWREWGPLESLLQVAGRINRNAEQSRAFLRVIPLQEGQGERVYGRILLEAARSHLPEAMSDLELIQRLDGYFQTIEQRISQAHAEALLMAVASLDYDRPNVDCRKLGASVPLSCFRLIEELPGLSIVVEQDDHATAAIKKLLNALGLEHPHERRLAVRQAFHELEYYTITPLLQRAVGNLPPPLLHGREDLRLITCEQLESFYDDKTGFKWDLSQFV